MYVTKPGEKVATIRTNEDLQEVWMELKSHRDKTHLWCDRLKVHAERKGFKRS